MSAKRKTKLKKQKPINWSKAFQKALAAEQDKDALEAVNLIRKLYWLVCVKHIDSKK